MRDDRVFEATRVLGAVIVPFLVVAFVLLYFFPDDTRHWFALPGVTALMIGLDGRWSAIQITLESQLIGLALILLATPRAREDIDTSTAIAYVFVAGIACLFAALLALELYMLGRRAGNSPSGRSSMIITSSSP